MRLLASLVTAAALALTAVPASALTRTVHVPVLNCKVTVSTGEVFVSANAREIKVARYGETGATTDC